MPPTRKPVRLASLRELDFTLASLRTDFIKQCFYATIISVFVPVIATVGLLALPCYRYWPERARMMRKLVYISVIAFLVCFGLPIFCVLSYGHAQFAQALAEHRLSTVEVFAPFVSYFLMQYFIVFVLHVSLTVERCVDDAKHVRRRQCETVFFESASTTIDRALTGAASRSVKVPLASVISDLEGLPGWNRLEDYDPTHPEMPADSSRMRVRRSTHSMSGASYGATDRFEPSPEVPGKSDLLVRHHSDLHEASLLAEDDASAAWEQLNVTLLMFLRKQVGHILDYPGMAVFIFCICVLRATLSRVWLASYWGFGFLPSDPLLCVFSVHSVLLTVFISGLWALLAINAITAYADNVEEMQLVSALVTVQARHVFTSTVLLPECKGDLHQFNRWCARLPRISMGHVENIKAWWMIREYALVDTMDERTTLEIVIFMGISALVLMTLQCLYDIYLAGAGSDVHTAITSFQVQAVVDIVLIGYLVCVAMLRMLRVNNILDEQGQLLLQARHFLLIPQASLMSLSENEVMEAMNSAEDASSLHRLPKASVLAADFLTHLNEVIRYDDFLQSLFGIEVTSFNVAQVVLGMITGLGSAFGGLYVLYKQHHGELTAVGHAPAAGATLVNLGWTHAPAVARALRG